jgi:uncharacterized membrane protein
MKNITKYGSLFIITLFCMLIIDLPYLYLNRNLYSNYTKSISGKSFTNRYYSGLFVYFALAIGIVVFVLPKIRVKGKFLDKALDALKYGGLFGIVTYGTFDFTMHYMFEGWDLKVSLIDTLWGGVLCSFATLLIIYISSLLLSLVNAIDYLEPIEPFLE